MNENIDKLWKLISTGSSENIDLALTLAKSQGISPETFRSPFEDLLRALFTKQMVEIFSEVPTSKALQDLFSPCSLDLSGILLKNAPKNIEKLQQLSTLNLSNNSLEIYPKMLHKLGKLSDLNLSLNKIKNLDSSICNLQNLQNINLRSNLLERLPKNIQELKRLRHLYLQLNPISNLEKKRIKILLPNCKTYF